jgi:uncharacterized membrane protein YhiD involved in acid resistance
MHYEEKLQLLWAMCFIVSGLIFALAFWFTPVIGTLAALGYIVLYVGLSISFLIVFSGMKKLSTHLSTTLKQRRSEIIEIQKELKQKYLKKKIDEESYRRLVERYESELTEINVKVKEIDKGHTSSRFSFIGK